MILPMAILSNNGFRRLKLDNFACAYGHLAECFYPWAFELNFVNLDSQQGYSPGSSRRCHWLSLRCLVPWINHMLHLCYSTVWKFSFKQNWSVSLTLRKTFFHCFYYVYRCKFTYVVIYDNISMALIYVPYFHIWNIALFLPSTHVLSFSIDVILTFSYWWPGDASANVTLNLRF